MKWTIYKITSPSLRVYIGKTSNYKKRLTYYKNYNNKGQTALFSSFKKYGFDSHKIEVVESFNGDDTSSTDKEMFWIRSFMSNKCKWPEMRGLNLTDGGEGTTGYKASEELKKRLSDIQKLNPTRPMLGKKLSLESIEKMRETLRKKGFLKPKQPKLIKIKQEKRIVSEETRMKMSLARKGKVPHNKGKKMPEHLKENFLKASIGRPSWNKGKSYAHLSEQERKRKFGAHNVGNSYNKGRKHSQKTVEAMKAARAGVPNPKNYTAIVYVNNVTGEIKDFNSLKEATSELNIPIWAIGYSLSGRFKLPKPYSFKYKAS